MSLGLNSKEKNKLKVSLSKVGRVQFEPHKSANIFKKFNTEIVTDLVRILPIALNMFISSTTKNDYDEICNCSRHPKIFLKALSRSNTNNAAGMDHINCYK